MTFSILDYAAIMDISRREKAERAHQEAKEARLYNRRVRRDNLRMRWYHVKRWFRGLSLAINENY